MKIPGSGFSLSHWNKGTTGDCMGHIRCRIAEEHQLRPNKEVGDLSSAPQHERQSFTLFKM